MNRIIAALSITAAMATGASAMVSEDGVNSARDVALNEVTAPTMGMKEIVDAEGFLTGRTLAATGADKVAIYTLPSIDDSDGVTGYDLR